MAAPPIIKKPHAKPALPLSWASQVRAEWLKHAMAAITHATALSQILVDLLLGHLVDEPLPLGVHVRPGDHTLGL
jgi:hypothetical protein